MNAELLMLVAGTCAFAVTLFQIWRRHLREKYAVGWLLLATLVLGLGFWPQGLMAFAQAMHLSYPAAALFLALAIMYPFSFSLSVSLSRQHRRSIRLVQQVALLEAHLRELGAAGAHRREL